MWQLPVPRPPAAGCRDVCSPAAHARAALARSPTVAALRLPSLCSYQPHGIKMLYDGVPVDLTPEQEEVATMFAVMKETGGLIIYD